MSRVPAYSGRLKKKLHELIHVGSLRQDKQEARWEPEEVLI